MANQINTHSPVRPPSVSHDGGDRVNEIHLMNEKKDKIIIRYHDGIRVGEVLNHG
jgi:hypothetical protein